MDQLLTRSLLAGRGVSDAELARQVDAGALERVRRGVDVRPADEGRTLEEQHLLLLGATVPHLDPGTVLSHGSAAVLHGLPVWPEAVDRVHITRPRQGGDRRRTAVYRHSSPLEPYEVPRLGEWEATTLARTAVDLARTVPLPQGLAAVDRALALGLDPGALAAGAGRSARWPGAGRARRAAALGDRGAESPGESVSRLLLLDLGLPAPEPQLTVVDQGRVVARVDFGWPALRTVAELDGRVRYGRLLRPGEDPGRVVWREELREDELRDLGWEIVRWVWADLDRPELIAERLHRVFRRGARRPGTPGPSAHTVPGVPRRTGCAS